MALLEARFDAPRNVYTAQGMGRSYLADRSAFGFRQLPGILKSTLWAGLSEAPASDEPPLVLITDLGNDLVYGSSPKEVADAAEACIERLKAWRCDCRFVMTRPPVEPVSKLGWMRFQFFRFVLFPTCPLTRDSIKQKTLELDSRIVEVADRQNIPTCAVDPALYGLDPIHVKRRHQSAVFGAAMDLWHCEPAATVRSSGEKHSRPTAALRWVWGRERQTSQPAVAQNGSRVFAY